MAFNQNQDTLKTLKLIIFLIVIESLFYFAQVVVIYAQGEVTNINIGTGIPETLDSYCLANGYAPPGSIIFDTDTWSSFRVPDGKLYKINSDPHLFIDIPTRFSDKGLLVDSRDAFGSIKALLSFVTFAIIPYPFNIIPTLITVLITVIILYLAFSEIKSWLSTFS
jgi:hypothetical protein